MASRQCPFCGQLIPEDSRTCYRCREDLPTAAEGAARDPAAGYHEIRRGLLYALLAGVIYYFASGMSAYEMPVEVPSFLISTLLPLMMLGGVGLFLYGVILKIRG